MSLAFLGAYTAAGVVFAILFQALGVTRIDPAAPGSGLGFKLVTFPGVVALWPVLAVRWVRRRPPPDERGPHRPTAAKPGASSPPNRARDDRPGEGTL